MRVTRPVIMMATVAVTFALAGTGLSAGLPGRRGRGRSSDCRGGDIRAGSVGHICQHDSRAHSTGAARDCRAPARWRPGAGHRPALAAWPAPAR